MPFENNYTIGRGEVFFSRRNPQTGLYAGERYLGNTSELNLNFDVENLDHYSMDRGIREKDASVPLQVNRQGSLVTDNIDPRNVALFFFGSTEALTIAAATVTGEQIVGVEKGMFYQLGATTANPSGARGLVYPGTGPTAFALTSGGTPLVEGVDYLINADLGRVELLETGTVVTNGSTLSATYSVRASTRQRVISGSNPVEGALRYVAYNPNGRNLDYYMPLIKLSPNGDFALKADEWQQIPLNIEILRAANREAVYVDGRPLFAA